MKNNFQKIVCLNSGSSSLKFSLYLMGESTEQLLQKGAIERIGLADGRFWLQDGTGHIIREVAGNYGNHNAAIAVLFSTLDERPSAIGHRVVHGGEFFTAPTIIGDQVIDRLQGLISFAPLHLPSEIECIKAVARRFPGLAQVACFDTAYHRKMPEIARRFPLPKAVWDEGVQRYGFHGLSYEYILEALGDKARGRIIMAHLGNGSSLAAVHSGLPLDTTMGFTPTGGFMMGTRCGDLDPGVLLYMMREKGYNVDQIDSIVNQQSGLLGVSGLTSDMKTLLDATDNPQAKLAIEMYCYQMRKAIGALAAALNGLDLLIFTGGIGEKAAPVRLAVCAGLEFLGISLDAQQNMSHAQIISSKKSSCTVMIIPTKEDLMIARHTRRIIDN
ncbi:MAG: acetate/propionate family kinase [Candidatus Schekmanbacteria bacterium]|nr:acetate/propionate family kinase [Candidatus Schekmanbacteria bacterium]